MHAVELEITQSWGDSFLRVERFAASRRLTAGSAGADFTAPLDAPVVLVEDGAVRVPGSPGPVVIGPDVDVRLSLGTQSFRIRGVAPVPPVPVDPLRRIDWFFVAVWFGFAAAVGAVVLGVLLGMLVLAVLRWLRRMVIAILMLWFGVDPIPSFLLPVPVVELAPAVTAESVLSARFVEPDEAWRARPVARPAAPAAPFFVRPTPTPVPTIAPIPMGDILVADRARPSKPVEKRRERVEEIRTAGLLGILSSEDSVALSSVFAEASVVDLEGEGIEGGVEGGVVGGIEGDAVYGGLIGVASAGESYGGGGLGLRGTGAGGGGTGIGGGGTAIGLGGLGTAKRAADEEPRGIGIGRLATIEAAPLGRVRRAGGTSDGGLEIGDVAPIVDRRNHTIRACYDRALAGDPTLSGKIIIAWTIHGPGTVSNLRTVSAPPGLATVSGCIERVIERMPFPPPRDGTEAEITIPFVLEAP